MSVFLASPRRARPLIVVAEDGVDARTMLGSMLDFHGFDVVLAIDGREALGSILVHRPDAVVSDMNMPHLDGLGLCRALRALPGDSLPVILWSSVQADDPRLLEAIALGKVEFLSKSLAITTIDAALRRILRPADPSFGPLDADAHADSDDQGVTLTGRRNRMTASPSAPLVQHDAA
jgi:two-component system response regulator MprA